MIYQNLLDRAEIGKHCCDRWNLTADQIGIEIIYKGANFNQFFSRYVMGDCLK